MAQMIDALKATVEAEKTKLLAELSQATEPRLSAIRKEIEACESLLQRLGRSRAPDRRASFKSNETQLRGRTVA